MCVSVCLREREREGGGRETVCMRVCLNKYETLCVYVCLYMFFLLYSTKFIKPQIKRNSIKLHITLHHVPNSGWLRTTVCVCACAFTL